MPFVVRLSPALLVVALSPAFLQTSSDCSTSGNPALSALSLQTDSVDRVVGFASATTSYDVWLAGASTMTVVAQSTEPGATLRWTYGQVSGDLGTGSGAATLTVMPGEPSLFVSVRSPGGASRHYQLTIDPSCTNGCDDGNLCTYDHCNIDDDICEPEPFSGFEGLPCDSVVVTDGACNDGVCAPLTWQGSRFIDTSGQGLSIDPKVVVDEPGRGLAVWERGTDIWANRYTPDDGWGVAANIDGNSTGNAVLQDLAITASGDGLALWVESDGTTEHIVESRFTPGAGWSAAQHVTPPAPTGVRRTFARVGFDEMGDAVMVWTQAEAGSGPFQVWTNRYTVGSGWSAPMPLQPDTESEQGVSDVDVAIAPSGDGFAVWSQRDPPDGVTLGNYNNIWVSRYDASTGWDTPIRIDESGASDFEPQVAVDPNGNAVAVWYEYSDTTSDGVWAARYAVGSGWGAPHRFPTTAGAQPGRIRVTVDESGHAIAFWENSQAFNPARLWSSWYSPQSGWGPIEAVESRAGDGGRASMAIGPSGEVLAVWIGYNTRYGYRTYANRFVAGSGWGLQETVGYGGNFGADMAMNSSGSAIAVFARYQAGSNQSFVSANHTSPDP